MISRLAILLALPLLAGACVRSTIEPLAPAGRYTPTVPESVVVYTSVEDVLAQNLEYDRVAMIFIRADARYTNENAIMLRAREDAAKLGANGVIMGDTREAGFWSADRQGRVLAIRTRPKRAAPAP